MSPIEAKRVLRLWDSHGKLYTRIIERERRLARIPVCQNCGVRCTVCAPKFGQPARCCLSSQLGREGQIQDSTPPEHPYDGESGETFDAQVFAGKPE